MQAMLPAERLADVVRRAGGHDRHRKEADRDHANREQDAGRGSRQRLQRFSRLGSARDLGAPGGVQRGRGGQDDEIHDDVGKQHAERNVPRD
jgi:hypothetical protein